MFHTIAFIFMVPISNETGVLSFRQDFNCVERKLLTLFKQTKKHFPGNSLCYFRLLLHLLIPFISIL
jgi:hypothetical protein